MAILLAATSKEIEKLINLTVKESEVTIKWLVFQATNINRQTKYNKNSVLQKKKEKHKRKIDAFCYCN